MSPLLSRPLAWVFVVGALAGAAPLGAQEETPAAPDPSAPGLQAVIATAADEQISARIIGLVDGRLQLATDPPREIALSDVARIDVGRVEAIPVDPAGDLIWIGQDNHDLVQVGGARGGNGTQDVHLHATNLRSVGLKQIVVVCRFVFPQQLRVWRLDTSQSPHWRLGLARADLAPEAELYIEPAAIDSFGQTFEITYTYNDGISAKSSVVATTHTSDQRRIDRAARPGSVPAKSSEPSTADMAVVYLADSDRLQGGLLGMSAESLKLGTKWKAEMEIPLLRVRGVWFGIVAPPGAEAEFERQLAAPADEDVVFAVAPDKRADHIQATVLGLADGQIKVRFQNQERSISQDRVLGVVFAAHPSPEKLPDPSQLFALNGGGQFSGKWVGIDDKKLEIETPWNSRIIVPAEQVGQIRVRGGKVTMLADLEPIAVEQVPYFGRLIPWRRDLGFDGEPPKLRGKKPTRSIAMHSRCVLSYALDGEYDKFKATLGFDDTAGTRGRVDIRVLVDGREEFSQKDFRANQDPLTVEVSTAGAKQMSLEVDFGEEQDVGDRILWAEPRLFRRADK
jgi:NPCBM/NEW2 domain